MHWGRAYFAVQAVAGAAWWGAVFVFPFLREATLGSLDPVAVAIVDIPLFVIGSAIAAWGVKAAAILTAGWTSFVAAALMVYATVTAEAGWGVLFMTAATAGSIVALLLVLFGRVPTEWIIRGPFAFRPAKARRTAGANVATTLGQIVIFWGTFLLVIPLAITFFEDRWGLSVVFAPFVSLAGVAALVLASALGLWSAFVMTTMGSGTPLPSAMPRNLVIAGPYCLVRNPMAIAGIFQGVAVGLILSSWLVIGYALIGSLLWNYAVRPWEEADLDERFGQEFQGYRNTVRCWIPRRHPFPVTLTVDCAED